MANPRKFSEKIALHNQKQAEETAAFERIMQEVSVTRVMPPRAPQTHLNPHPQAYLRPYLGGSLPNVNQIASNPQMELQHPGGFDDMKHPMRHPGRLDSRMRPYTHRRMMPFDINRHRPGHFDAAAGQYPNPYLSPPPESNWRSFPLSRTNSDSALHQSAMNPNAQDHYNPGNAPMHHPVRRDFMDNNFSNMPPYKAMFEKQKIEQHLQAGNRPKSCEAPTINLLQSEVPGVIRTGADGSAMPLSGNGAPPQIPVSLASLSHVTQIGNNTGSLPDLTNLHIPSPLSNPIDYDDAQQQNQQQSQTNNHSIYNQSARSTGNLPAASAIPHMGAGNMRTPASPNRARRHTHNGPGPSPLSLGSPEHTRRIKYPNVTSPKMVGVKSEMKSPPIGGSYTYPYPQQTNMHSSPHHNQGPIPPSMDGRVNMGWQVQNQEHPGSPSHAQNARNMQQGQSGSMQRHVSQQSVDSGGHPLRVDVNAASKVGHQQYQQNRTTQGSITSPLTSPTSPTHTQANFSPVTSPRHEFTTGSNPALSEAYYRSEMSAASLQPLQHQFEQIHVVNDSTSSPHHSTAPPMYSCLAALSEASDGVGGLFSHRSDGQKHGHVPNNINRIPDIVFTGVDEHPGKSGPFSGGDLSAGFMSHELSSEYFPGDELKVNLGLEELQMLEDSHIVTDPVMEDQLSL
uniref:CREB-regulated transcription coactivator 1-like n=1 Tax=Phallusia mammillata TaxID=59560 RepID=A0A6F9D9F3_9ASCI|nr:CREB-regulated transcription coactivator 1-like [Phallusia mammillata]